MYNMFIYSVFMFVVFMFSFIWGIMMYYWSWGVILEWLIYSPNSVNVEMFILLDWISLIFISVVMLISSMVMVYSVSYMSGDMFMGRFYLLVFMFIVSMLLMIVSPNLLSVLLGWDGLGLVSFCLVIYYQNQSSYNSGMVTVLSNRLGDVGLLMAIGLMFICGSWNMCMLSSKENLYIIFLVFLAAITKSAQIPFSYWLPQAMAAPTPVSSLVHSSTLVTAGVYLLIRFNFYLCESGINFFLMFLSVLTSLMSGVMANFEYDLKKIIALSTLSQLGLMMLILSAGMPDIAFFHLIIHALFKSLLFLCSGVMIHYMVNNQDIRFYGGLNEFIPLVMMSFYISSLALCGMPFLSGFYSKDLLIESFNLSGVNLFLVIFCTLSVVATVSYTIRLFYYVFYGEVLFYYSWFIFPSSWLMNMSMCILIIFSIISGSAFSWLIFDSYEPYMDLSIKLITISACFLGLMVGLTVCLVNFLKFYFLSYFISSMWMTMFLYSFIYKPFITYGCLVGHFDKTWSEFLLKFNFLFVVESLKGSIKLNYKIYMFSCLIILLIVVIF